MFNQSILSNEEPAWLTGSLNRTQNVIGKGKKSGFREYQKALSHLMCQTFYRYKILLLVGRMSESCAVYYICVHLVDIYPSLYSYMTDIPAL